MSNSSIHGASLTSSYHSEVDSSIAQESLQKEILVSGTKVTSASEHASSAINLKAPSEIGGVANLVDRKIQSISARAGALDTAARTRQTTIRKLQKEILAIENEPNTSESISQIEGKMQKLVQAGSELSVTQGDLAKLGWQPTITTPSASSSSRTMSSMEESITELGTIQNKHTILLVTSGKIQRLVQEAPKELKRPIIEKVRQINDEVKAAIDELKAAPLDDASRNKTLHTIDEQQKSLENLKQEVLTTASLVRKAPQEPPSGRGIVAELNNNDVTNLINIRELLGASQEKLVIAQQALKQAEASQNAGNLTALHNAVDDAQYVYDDAAAAQGLLATAQEGGAPVDNIVTTPSLPSITNLKGSSSVANLITISKQIAGAKSNLDAARENLEQAKASQSSGNLTRFYNSLTQAQRAYNDLVEAKKSMQA